MTDQQMKSISVEDLLRSGNITRRTYHTLVKARLRTLYDLRKYKNGLRRLFSPQSPSVNEVADLLEKASTSDLLPNISGKLFMDSNLVEKSKGEQLLDSLSEKEQLLLAMTYDNLLKALLASRQRAHTVIANALSQVPVNVFVRDFLYEDDDKIMILYNVGKTSVEHFVEVKKAMLREVENLQQHPETLPYRIFMQQTHGAFKNNPFIREFFDKHQRLPILYIAQEIIIQNKSRAEVKAFLNRYDIFEGRVELDKTPIDRSAYTIATYSNTIYDALFDPKVNMRDFDNLAYEVLTEDSVQNNLMEYFDDDFITEDHPRLAQIIEDEQLLLAPRFIIALLGKLLTRQYAMLGGYPRSLLTAKNERWNHVYLIDRSIDEKYDFRGLLTNFRDNVCAKAVDNIVVDMEEYIQSQLPEHAEDEHLTLAVDIMRTLVKGELLLDTDIEGKVCVPRCIERPLADRLYIILAETDQQPISLTRLTEIINSGDGRKYVKATVSLALNKDPRFVNNGKKGLYALAEWQLPYFGSNIDIIYQVLSQSERPMESDEILDVLNQFPYNESLGKNELSSVISITKDKFKKYGFGYYGLVDREYDPELIRPVRNNFELDMQTYRDFVDKYHRLPSSKNNAEEKKLVYWFTRKKKEYDNNARWAKAKREAFKEIVALYEEYQNIPIEPETITEFADSVITGEHTLEEPIIAEEPTAVEGLGIVEEPVIAVEPTAVEGPGIVEEPVIAEEPTSVEEPVIAEEPIIVEESVSPGDSINHEDSEGTGASVSPEESVTPVSSEWNDFAEKVGLFVRQQHREPLSLFTAEYEMAQWLQTQKACWHEGMLTQEQERILLDIRDMIW